MTGVRVGLTSRCSSNGWPAVLEQGSLVSRQAQTSLEPVLHELTAI